MVFVLFKLFCISGAIASSFYTVGALTRTHALTNITLTVTRFPSRTTFFGGHSIQPSHTAAISRGQSAFGLALRFAYLCSCGRFHEQELEQRVQPHPWTRVTRRTAGATGRHMKAQRRFVTERPSLRGDNRSLLMLGPCLFMTGF